MGRVPGMNCDNDCRYKSAPALNQIDSVNLRNPKKSKFFYLRNSESQKRLFFQRSSLPQPSSCDKVGAFSDTKLTFDSSRKAASVSNLDDVFDGSRFGSNLSINTRSWNDCSRLSGNPASMTQAYSVSRGPADPDGSAGAPLTTTNSQNSEMVQASRSSKGRQKKFHRHFKEVDCKEKVLNYYSCALVGDILLQGHLYITENFFAFYSNVFGYVTKLLIPTISVSKISKEKTAKIIPNAVGISTEDEKHVFGSLLSRDSTYKFMLEVWKSANSSQSVVNITPQTVAKPDSPSDDDSSISSGNEERSSYISNVTPCASLENLKLIPNKTRTSFMVISKEGSGISGDKRSFKVMVLLVLSFVLLACLVFSAGYFLYKIALIQNHFSDFSSSSKENMYEEILMWQATLHSASANKIQEFLTTSLNEITKVRVSLEALTTLILSNQNKSEVLNFKSKTENPRR